MKRIIIQLTTLGKKQWNLIYKFIEKCNGRGDFSQQLFYDLKAIASIVVNDNPQDDDVATIAGMRHFNYEEFSTLSDTIINIIYKKKDDCEEFSDIPPFFLLKKHFGDRLTLGIDVGCISDQNKRYSYIFQCSIFLYFIKDKHPILGRHSIYFINGMSSGLESGNSISSLRYKNTPPDFINASPFIFPLLHINKNTFGIFDGECAVEEDVNHYIENSMENIRKRLGKRSVDLSGCGSLFEKWFVLSYRLVSSEDDEGFLSMKELLLEYCHSIFELVQNIVFHAQEKRGLLYFTFSKQSKILASARNRIRDIDKYAPHTYFLECGIYDYGRKGIIQTFYDVNHIRLPLKVFFNPRRTLSGPLSSHLGIRFFVNSIIDNNGCFRVETNVSDTSKQTLEYSRNRFSDSSIIENIGGTHYDIIMPVDSHKSNGAIIQYESIFRHLKQGLKDSSYIKQVRSKTLEGLVRHSFIGKQNQENYVAEAAVSLIQEITWIIQTSDRNGLYYGIAVDMKGLNIRPNILFKIIDALPQANLIDKKLEHDFFFVFTNLSEETIRFLCNDYYTDISQKNVKQRFPIILMGEKWQIQILYGKTIAELLYVNRRIHAFYFSDDVFAKDNDYSSSYLTGAALRSAEKLIIPYDVLIKEANGESLFISLINRNMDVPIGKGEKDTSCLLGMPTKIGNKIYVENYYEADYLFQNNFFTDRFSFFIAKTIYEMVSRNEPGFNRKLILIGYNPYSGPLTERVRDYVNSESPGKIAGVVIAKEDDVAKGLDFKMSEDLKTSICNTSNEYGFITIVPIASTLSTNDKISTLFKRRMPDGIELLFVYNFVTIIVRDILQHKCTEKEVVWKWKRITGNTISTSFQEDGQVGKEGMRVDCLVQKEGIWHRLIDEYTFPKEWWREIYINQTRNASVNTKSLLGFPVVAMPSISEMRDELGASIETNDDTVIRDYYQLTVRKMWEMKDSVLFGHIDHNGVHHRYYFDVEHVFETLIKEESNTSDSASLTKQDKKRKKNKQTLRHLSAWLEYLRGQVDRGELNVLVTPDNDSESCYVNAINRVVFDDNACVIYLNTSDPRQNSKQKLSYLKQSVTNGKARFYFLDQALLTGESYHNVKRYIASILGENDFSFEGVITVINRLSRERYDEIYHGLKPFGEENKHIFSYLHFFMLPSRASDTSCYLCSLREHFKEIKRYSDVRSCRAEIERNRTKYETKSFSHYLKDEPNDDVEKSCLLGCMDSRAWRRMLWIHRLCFEIAAVKDITGITELINTLYGKLDHPERDAFWMKDISIVDDKISFLKAISYPPLSQYASIRACAHELQLNQLHDVLSKESPNKDDLDLMLVLLKHLALLGSNALVRKDVIEGAWNLYVKVREKQRPSNIIKCDQFISRFLFFIKVATYKDEAKSLWLGELLRTGNEIDATKSISITGTVLFNGFFNSFRDRAKSFRKNFLPQLFLENTAITRKTLESLELALKKDNKLKGFYYDDSQLRPFASICKSINDIVLSIRGRIDTDYIYSWFRLYLDKNNKTADGIPILERMAYILYARLLLRDFMDSSKENIVSFDKNAEQLLEIATKILNADAAYLSIKTEAGLEPLITLAKYNIEKNITDYENFYSKELVMDSFSGRGRPFVIVHDLRQMGEKKLGAFSRATYLMLEIPRKDKTKPDLCVGVITFLYPLEGNDDAFMINAQECGRLLLLLKPDLDEYAKHIADEKQFEVWKEKIENQTRFERVYSNSNHIFRLVFDQMDEFENIQYDILTKLNANSASINEIEEMTVISFTDTWFWLTNEMISYFYANIERHHEDGKHFLCLDKGEAAINLNHKTRDLFNRFFIKMLKSLLGNRWSGQCIAVNGKDISVENEEIIMSVIPEATIPCNKHLMQTFIVQCLNNSLRNVLEEGGHNKCEKKRVLISVDKQAITIKDEVIKGEAPNKKEIDEFAIKQKMIQEMDCHKYSCTTLTSLQGFVNHMKEEEGKAFACSYGYNGDNPSFEVKIYYNQSI